MDKNSLSIKKKIYYHNTDAGRVPCIWNSFVMLRPAVQAREVALKKIQGQKIKCRNAPGQ